MQFEIQKSALEQELNRMVGIAGRRASVISALSHIAVNATNGKLKMMASDLSITLITESIADVQQAGSACVPAGKLLDIVRLASDGVIKFSLMANGWIKVKTDSSMFKLPAVARDQFPEPPTVSSPLLISVPSDLLKQLIYRTMFAMSKQEGDYSLHCIKLDIASSSIKMIATDGQRVAIAKSPLPNTPDELNTLIPDFTATQLLKLAEDHDGDVGIQLSTNHIHFQLGKRVLISTLTTGEFPDCELLLPKVITASIEFNTERFALAIRRAALMAQNKGRSILLDFTQGKISAANAEDGEAQEVLPTEVRLPLIIAFNYQFLLDVLENIRSEHVVLDLQSVKTQAQLRPADEKDGNEYRSIIMPMINQLESVIKDPKTEPAALSLD